MKNNHRHINNAIINFNEGMDYALYFEGRFNKTEEEYVIIKDVDEW